ncbi:prohead assembly (scaffolding) protein [Providencia phage PSTCR6]|nr:prohead assembly (scaffolding) protein [Providencia phage PSTCR6]
MLKEDILKEAEKLQDISVELDGIFEAVELSEDVKAQFSTVFEATVKSKAASLAESHIESLTQYAETRIGEIQEAAEEKAYNELAESVSKFMDHLSEKWLEENKLAVTNGIKAGLFESMFAGIKELVIEHNVVLPEESVDVVAEMEEEMEEQRAQLQDLFDEKVALKEENTKLKRDAIVKEATLDLTESQKEKVQGLIEGISFDDKFSTTLSSIVEMVVKSSAGKEANDLQEGINNTDDDGGLNYTPEVLKEEKQSDPMDVYTRAAKRLN